MLLHKDKKFIYKNLAAIEIPNNVYLDPSPDPCPIEGMVLYTEDTCAKVDIHFVTTEKDARTFLKEGTEVFESYKCTKPTAPISANGLEGFTVAYTTSRYIYEEFVFTLVDGSELLNIFIEQKRDKPADPTQYARLVADLLKGVKAI